MDALVSDPLVGQTVDGRYDVLRRIARGGMATVYLATDRRLDRLVALKVMHPHLADGTDVAARFRREARAAARLSHPGVVAVLDQGVDGETSYLTMEYVPGRTLRTEIAGQGALRLGTALELTDSILDALASAHRAGLVHRDIKPENVLLTRDGHAKIGDFGLARAVTEATAATTGTLLGTVAYLSPEIVRSGEADARTDVYAVGIMLYEMLTGTPPYEGATPIQIAYRHVHEDVPPPSDRVPWLPMDVDDLVGRLTARDPMARPADAVAALELVRRVREGLEDRALALRADVPGRPELLVEHDLAQDERDAQAAATAAQAPTTTLDRGPGTGTIALPIGAVEAPATPGPPPAAKPARPRRSRGLAIVLIALILLAGVGAGWWFSLGPGSRVTIPNVVGMPVAEAQAQITDLGLELSEPAEAYDDAAPAGDVLSVSPGEGERVERDSSVQLTVSLGIEHVTMPEVIGQTQDDAVAALTAVGLAASEPELREDRNAPAGQVLEASVAAGESIPHTTVIDLVVSSGPRLVTIPDDYVGKSRDVVVTDLLRLLDIPEDQIAITEEYSDDIPAGSVIAVTPAPGSTDIAQGTPAEVVVSLGPELREVPNVMRMGLDEAIELLENQGFRVETKSSWGGVIGQVVDQDPNGGTMAAFGSTVTLTYI